MKRKKKILTLPFHLCKTRTRTSGGQGRRVHLRGTPPVFYQHAFAEAVGVAVAAIVQASAVGGQGGPSDLQRFMSHHPPSFRRGSDGSQPLVPTGQKSFGGHGDYL